MYTLRQYAILCDSWPLQQVMAARDAAKRSVVERRIAILDPALGESCLSSFEPFVNPARTDDCSHTRSNRSRPPFPIDRDHALQLKRALIPTDHDHAWGIATRLWRGRDEPSWVICEFVASPFLEREHALRRIDHAQDSCCPEAACPRVYPNVRSLRAYQRSDLGGRLHATRQTGRPELTAA
jgi:hypothetical protein